jgi:hypothetical protein
MHPSSRRAESAPRHDSGRTVAPAAAHHHGAPPEDEDGAFGEPADLGTLAGRLDEAGATWWSGWLGPLRGGLETTEDRVRRGPPRV